MLSLNKDPIKPAQAVDYYYAKDSVFSVEDSKWMGEGAKKLGLAGAVSMAQFENVMFGRHPKTGEQLVEIKTGTDAKDRRAMNDLTFSMSKSESLAVASGVQDVQEAHDAAIGEVMKYIEKHYSVARRPGGDEITGNMVIAAFKHSTSRENDPQFHTHVAVANQTMGKDGRWLANEPELIYWDKQQLGLLYRQAKATILHQKGYSIEFTGEDGLLAELTGANQNKRDKMIFELKGVPRELIKDGSTRRAMILAKIAEYKANGAYQHMSPAELLDKASLDTRKVKESLSKEELYKKWDDLFAGQGLTRDQLAEQLVAGADMDRAGRSLSNYEDVNGKTAEEVVAQAVSILDDNEARNATTSIFAKAAEISGGRHTLDALQAEIEKQTAIQGTDSMGRETRASQKMIALERATFSQISNLGEHEAPATVEELKSFIGRYSERENFRFMPGQDAGLFADFCGVKSLIVNQGDPGVGKTRSLEVARAFVDEVLAPSGRYYISLLMAPSATAALEQSEAAGCEAHTIEGFLNKSSGVELDKYIYAEKIRQMGIHRAHLEAKKEGGEAMLRAEDLAPARTETMVEHAAFQTLGHETAEESMKELHRMTPKMDNKHETLTMSSETAMSNLAALKAAIVALRMEEFLADAPFSLSPERFDIAKANAAQAAMKSPEYRDAEAAVKNAEDMEFLKTYLSEDGQVQLDALQGVIAKGIAASEMDDINQGYSAKINFVGNSKDKNGDALIYPVHVSVRPIPAQISKEGDIVSPEQIGVVMDFNNPAMVGSAHLATRLQMRNAGMFFDDRTNVWCTPLENNRAALLIGEGHPLNNVEYKTARDQAMVTAKEKSLKHPQYQAAIVVHKQREAEKQAQLEALGTPEKQAEVKAMAIVGAIEKMEYEAAAKHVAEKMPQWFKQGEIDGIACVVATQKSFDGKALGVGVKFDNDIQPDTSRMLVYAGFTAAYNDPASTKPDFWVAPIDSCQASECLSDMHPLNDEKYRSLYAEAIAEAKAALKSNPEYQALVSAIGVKNLPAKFVQELSSKPIVLSPLRFATNDEKSVFNGEIGYGNARTWGIGATKEVFGFSEYGSSSKKDRETKEGGIGTSGRHTVEEVKSTYKDESGQKQSIYRTTESKKWGGWLLSEENRTMTIRRRTGGVGLIGTIGALAGGERTGQTSVINTKTWSSAVLAYSKSISTERAGDMLKRVETITRGRNVTILTKTVDKNGNYVEEKLKGHKPIFGSKIIFERVERRSGVNHRAAAQLSSSWVYRTLVGDLGWRDAERCKTVGGVTHKEAAVKYSDSMLRRAAVIFGVVDAERAAMGRSIKILHGKDKGKEIFMPGKEYFVKNSDKDAEREIVGKSVVAGKVAPDGPQLESDQSGVEAGKHVETKVERINQISDRTKTDERIQSVTPDSGPAKVSLGLVSEESIKGTKAPVEEIKEGRVWTAIKIDEASMAGAKQIHMILNAREALVEKGYIAPFSQGGDAKQLSSVGSGNVFAQSIELCKDGGGTYTEAKSIVRQRSNPELQGLVTDYNKAGTDRQMAENAAVVVQSLLKKGYIHECEKGGLLEKAKEFYLSESAKPSKSALGEKQSVILMAGTNVDRLAINKSVREARMAAGEIDKGQTQDILVEAKGISSTADGYKVGMLVEINGERDVKTGKQGVSIKDADSKTPWSPSRKGVSRRVSGIVVGTDLKNNTVSIEFPMSKGRSYTKRLDATSLKRQSSTYEKVQRDMSIGDKILFFKNGELEGGNRVSNGHSGEVVGYGEGGKMRVRMDHGDRAVVGLDPERYKHFDLGYASTVNKAQGKTVDLSVFLHSAKTAFKSFNVAFSRMRDGLVILTSNYEGLMKQVQQVEKKTTTITSEQHQAAALGISDEQHKRWTSAVSEKESSWSAAAPFDNHPAKVTVGMVPGKEPASPPVKGVFVEFKNGQKVLNDEAFRKQMRDVGMSFVKRAEGGAAWFAAMDKSAAKDLLNQAHPLRNENYKNIVSSDILVRSKPSQEKKPGGLADPLGELVSLPAKGLFRSIKDMLSGKAVAAKPAPEMKAKPRPEKAAVADIWDRSL